MTTKQQSGRKCRLIVPTCIDRVTPAKLKATCGTCQQLLICVAKDGPAGSVFFGPWRHASAAPVRKPRAEVDGQQSLVTL